MEAVSLSVAAYAKGKITQEEMIKFQRLGKAVRAGANVPDHMRKLYDYLKSKCEA